MKELAPRYLSDKEYKFTLVNSCEEIISLIEKKEKIDLLLVDLYSPKEDIKTESDLREISKISNDDFNSAVKKMSNKDFVEYYNQGNWYNTNRFPIDYGAKFIEEVFHGFNQETLSIEDKLTIFQRLRENVRNNVKKQLHPYGIEDIEYLVNRKNILIDFPIALYTRYGRTLLFTEEITKLNSMNVYFVWKEKDKHKSDDRTIIPTREKNCIRNIVENYRVNVNKHRDEFEKLKDRLESNIKKRDREKAKQKNKAKYAIASGFKFHFALILVTLYNLRFLLKDSYVEMIDGGSIGKTFIIGLSIVSFLTLTIDFVSRYVKMNNYDAINIESIYHDMNILLRRIRLDAFGSIETNETNLISSNTVMVQENEG